MTETEDNELNEKIVALENQLVSDEGNIALRYDLAKLYCKAQRFEDAIEQYKTLADTYNESRAIGLITKLCYFNLKDQDTIMDLIEKYSFSEKATDDPFTNYYLGLAYYNGKIFDFDFDKAMYYLKRIDEKHYDEIFFIIAKINLLNNDLGEADRYFKMIEADIAYLMLIYIITFADVYKQDKNLRSYKYYIDWNFNSIINVYLPSTHPAKEVISKINMLSDKQFYVIKRKVEERFNRILDYQDFNDQFYNANSLEELKNLADRIIYE